VGAIVDSLDVPVWVAHFLEQVDSSNCLELTLLVCIGEKLHPWAWKDLGHAHGSLLFRAWTWIDYRLFKTRTREPNALEIVRFTSKHGTPQVLRSSHQGSSLGACDLGAIRAAHTDVLLDFTGTAPPEVRNCARYGLWSLERGGTVIPSLLHDMCDGRSELEVILDLKQNGTDESLGSLRFPTDFLSLFRNYNRYCWDQAKAMARTLRGLQLCGWGYVKEQLRTCQRRNCELPGNGATAFLLLRCLSSGSRIALDRGFRREDWFIAYRQSCPVLVPETAPSTFVVVRAPRDRFYADPFVVEKDGRTFIFFEDYSFSEGKGAISVIEIDAVGNPGKPEPVLEASYHLSYPCVFEWDGEMYMVPETKDNRTIELYRSDNFPRGWRRERVLMRGVSTVDSTILRYQGKFWLFTSGLNESKRLFRGDNELFLLFSETPFGPWVPHPKNPVVSGVRRARPAGQLFFEGGQLIRPSQDCLGLPGRGVCLNRVDLLSESDYAETPIATVASNWFTRNIGTHTFNQSSRYQVIDGRTLASRFIKRFSRRRAHTVHTKSAVPLIVLNSPLSAYAPDPEGDNGISRSV